MYSTNIHNTLSFSHLVARAVTLYLKRLSHLNVLDASVRPLQLAVHFFTTLQPSLFNSPTLQLSNHLFSRTLLIKHARICGQPERHSAPGARMHSKPTVRTRDPSFLSPWLVYACRGHGCTFIPHGNTAQYAGYTGRLTIHTETPAA
jgi:hypothetical protein